MKGYQVVVGASVHELNDKINQLRSNWYVIFVGGASFNSLNGDYLQAVVCSEVEDERAL